jgi:hypothetical protein
MTEKAVKKSRSNSRPANAIDAKNGGYLIPGKGKGAKKGAPNAGRPPDKFKELCQSLACTGADVAPVILKNPDHPAYLGALKWATEHGYGKPEQSLDLTSGGKSLEALLAAAHKLTP